MICNDVGKYFSIARKSEAKADLQVEQLDVIAILQVSTKRLHVMHGSSLTCKEEFTSSIGPCKERLEQNTSNFGRHFSAALKNFLASQKTCQHKCKHILILRGRHMLRVKVEFYAGTTLTCTDTRHQYAPLKNLFAKAFFTVASRLLTCCNRAWLENATRVATTMRRGNAGENWAAMRTRYIVIVIAIATITGSYWLAADPPNPWFLAIAAAGLLVSIGITIAKTRAGHFDKN